MISEMDGKKGIQCPCGQFHVYPLYVYAHTRDVLTFKCDNCKKKYCILNLEYSEVKQKVKA